MSKKSKQFWVSPVDGERYQVFIGNQGYYRCHDSILKTPLVHRREMEKIVGHKLSNTDIVHHKDGNKLNNAPDNLVLTDIRNHRRTNCELLSKAEKFIKSKGLWTEYTKTLVSFI